MTRLEVGFGSGHAKTGRTLRESILKCLKKDWD